MNNASPDSFSSIIQTSSKTIRPSFHIFLLSLSVPIISEFLILILTGKIDRFMWLFEQAASGLIYVWPISVPAAIWFCSSFTTTAPPDQLDTRRLLWLAPLIVIPITILAWGAVFSHRDVFEFGRRYNYAHWQLSVVHWAFYVSVAIGIVAVIHNSGRRSFVASSTILLLLFILSCSITAGSSITGDWL